MIFKEFDQDIAVPHQRASDVMHNINRIYNVYTVHDFLSRPVSKLVKLCRTAEVNLDSLCIQKMIIPASDLYPEYQHLAKKTFDFSCSSQIHTIQLMTLVEMSTWKNSQSYRYNSFNTKDTQAQIPLLHYKMPG